MRAPRGDAEQTKAEIIKAARRLFTDKGIRAVSVRDVAAAAGVTHGLVHHYFGTKEQLAEEVIRKEALAAAEVLAANEGTVATDPLQAVRTAIRYFLTEGRDSVLLMTRAELTGFQPERLRPREVAGPLEIVARQLAQLQAGNRTSAPRPDPALVSVFIGAVVVGLVAVNPWLMASAGLGPDEYESRLDEIVEMGVAFVLSSVGIDAEGK